MSTYVMGDIHGCFEEFQQMLRKVALSEADRLILTGDYIDRGPDSLKMLRWLENCPVQVTPLRGNHDEEFAAYVDALCQIDSKWDLQTRPDSHEDAAALYDTAKYLFKTNGLSAALFFDRYGTLGHLLHTTGITMDDLHTWRSMIRGNCRGIRTLRRIRRTIILTGSCSTGREFAGDTPARSSFLCKCWALNA